LARELEEAPLEPLFFPPPIKAEATPMKVATTKAVPVAQTPTPNKARTGYDVQEANSLQDWALQPRKRIPRPTAPATKADIARALMIQLFTNRPKQEELLFLGLLISGLLGTLIF
jgi:hypothetical protein